MGAPVINAAEFAAFILVLLRISIFIALAPVFRAPQIPTTIKAILILMLAFVMAPHVEYDPSLMPMTWYGFVVIGFGELFIAFTLCFMVRLVIDSSYVAGEYISFMMGLSMVNAMDPGGGGQTPLLGMLLNMLFTLIFLYANGHLLVIKAMADSFQVAPPGLINIWNPAVFTEVVRALAGLYILAIKIAAPLIAVMFCIQVAFGVTAKAMPQMNIMFVGIPVYIIVGMLVMSLSMPWWPPILGEALYGADQAMDRILVYLTPATR